ncbi:PREDICTED: uncharacterized protein LOC106786822, partial [Polistes canadensis]|uniref:uncharacterized protein LOC106786822 n=1 Tax=Polistes canadensis TaxID=91411 RepID=UPI000718BE64
MTVRIFFILTIFQYFVNNALAVSGLIWDKRQQNFVQLYSIPKFAILHAEARAKNRQTELYHFDRKPIRVTYYEVCICYLYISMFYENDTKITGLAGDLWTTLSDYLNFTLIPVKCPTISFGKLLPNGSYDGVMGMLQRNETDVILRTGQYKFHKNNMAFTVPIYRTGSNLIYQMTNRKVIPPFYNITDLFHKTDYIIIGFFGSMIHEEFEARIKKQITDNPKWNNRVQYVAENRDLFTKVCKTRDKYSIFEIQDMYIVASRYICTLIPVGKLYFPTWITFGIQKYLPYKRTIDVAIIKMQEVGLVDRLKDSWLFIKLDNKMNNEFQKIDLNQIYVIFSILSIGFITSFVVLAIEHVIFYYESKKATIQDLFGFSLTIGGVIWNKNLGAFVPIFSINRYWMIHQEESNIVSYSDNDTKISGLAADIWNLLAESLNFTLKTIRSDVTTVGTFTINEKGIITYQGLLGLLQQNKTDVVPKIGMYPNRIVAATFTPALWTTL